MKRSTREWVEKAEGDHQLAVINFADGRFPDHIAFHCQQAAEKYLRALLNEHSLFIPKTHDLATLFDLLIPLEPNLKGQRRGLKALTKFAVVSRYPGKRTQKREVEACVRWANRARTVCRAALGLT